MSSKTIFFNFLAVLALFLAGADAATITVGPEGCDHVSIQAAIDAACPGDVVEVAGGTYRENLVVDMPLVLRGSGNGTEKPIVDACGRGSAVTLVADGVQLEGFVLENGGFGWAGIEIRSKDNLVRGNLVTDNRWYGVFLDGSSGSVIEENVVWKNKYGIWINAGSDDNMILKNVLQENENYNAFHLGSNLWVGNFYDDFDGSAPVYEVPGISSTDPSPSGPEKEPIVEPEKVIEADNIQEGETGEDLAAEDALKRESDTPDSGDISDEEQSEALAPEASPFEESAKKAALSLMDLGLAQDYSAVEEKQVEAEVEVEAEVSTGPAAGDAIVDSELGEAEAIEFTEVPKEPIAADETPAKAVEAYTAEDWVGRGNSLSRSGRYDDAASCYDQAIEMEPELADAWDGKGGALMMTGSYDKAVRCYERALEIDPNSAESWYNKGNALQMLLRFDEALSCYNEALRIDPRFAEAWNKKGMTLNRLRRYQEALDSFDEALKIAPGYATAWNNKSWAHQMLGDDAAAKDAFEKARTLGYS